MVSEIMPVTTYENSIPNYVNDEISESLDKYNLRAGELTVTEIVEETVDGLPEVKVEHIKIYESIFAYYTWLGLWFGAETRYEWKRYRSPLLWIIYFLLALCNYCILYHTAYDFYRKGEYGRMLEPLSCCGLCFTCTLKWWAYLKFMNSVLSLIFAARKICKNITSGPKADTLTARLKNTYGVIRVYSVGLTGVIIFYVSVAMKFFLIDGIYYPLMPVRIPFCDGETLKGYLSMLAIQSVFGVYSAVSTLTFGISFLILLGNYALMADLVEMDMKELNDMWTTQNDTTIAYRHAFLHNIVKKLTDMQRYMNEIKSIYELKFFIYFLISYVGQVIILYQITQGDKMCSFIEDTNWYEYDIYTQKTLRFMLQLCQVPCEISLGSIGPLNMVTGIGVIKGIYSYYTVLTEMM